MYKPKIAVTEKSGNKKTGPILTTKTEKKTCPKSCPLYDVACYAQYGPLAWHWKAMEQGKNARGKPINTSWDRAMNLIAKQKPGSLWRYGEAGDLPGENEKIDYRLMLQLIKANQGKRGFTYTHKYKLKANLDKIKRVNRTHFTINLSANDPGHADQLIKLEIGPVVCLLPHDQRKNSKTPNGVNVIVCPAVTKGITCLNCKLCSIKDRNFVIGFPGHGPAKKRIALPLA